MEVTEFQRHEVLKWLEQTDGSREGCDHDGAATADGMG